MQPLPVTQTGFDGVAKGVAKVQNSAQARFALVLRHHVGFDLAAALDRMGQRHRVTGQQRIQVGRDPVQKAQVCYRAILDDLGQAGAEFALRQGAQHLQVAHHQLRLVEGAYHVLAQRVVDAGLATDRRIDLRQQRGGQLHKRHAAHETGRGKAGHVADHPATERKQHRLTVASLAQQGVKNQVQGLPGLVLLAIGQHHLLNLPVLSLQRAAQALQVERGHRRIGDDQGLAGLWQVGVGLRLTNQAAANQNRVTALRQVDADNLGGCMLHGFEFRGCWGRGRRRGRPSSGVLARQHPEQLELHDDHVDQGGHRRATGLDHKVRGLPVQRVARGVQITQAGQGIGDLQQGPLAIVAQAAKQLVWV